MSIILVLLLALTVLSCHRPQPHVAPHQAVVVDLTWNPPADTATVERYEVYRRPAMPAAEILACQAPKGTHRCTDPAPFIGTNLYTAYSFGNGMWSAPSNMIEIRVEEEPPPAAGVPQQLRVIKVTIQGPPPAP